MYVVHEVGLVPVVVDSALVKVIMADRQFQCKECNEVYPSRWVGIICSRVFLSKQLFTFLNLAKFKASI